MATFALAGTAINVVAKTKTAIDTFRKLNEGVLPDDGFVIWKTLESLTPALELCLDFNKRHELRPYVGSACELARWAAVKCEEWLQADEDPEDGRPSNKESWATWFSSKKEGVSRKQRIPEVLQRLQMAQQALQLSLTAVAAAVPPAQRQPCAPFRWLPAAMEQAQQLIQQFEFGRTSSQRLAVGQLHGSIASSTRKGQSVWALLHEACEVILLRSEDKFQLQTKRVKHSTLPDEDQEEDQELDQEATEHTLDITRHLQPRRHWRGDVAGLDSAAEDLQKLVYVWRGGEAEVAGASGAGERTPSQVLLQFESVDTISAEVFEAVLFMVTLADGHKPLAEVVDIDSEEFKAQMHAELPFEASNLGALPSNESNPGAVATPLHQRMARLSFHNPPS